MVKEVFFCKIKSKVTAAERCGSSAYYKCQWSVSGVSGTYLVYRWLHLLTLVGVLLASLLSREEGLQGRWLIFLTNWALLLYLSQAVLGLHLVQTATAADRKGEPVKFSAALLEVYGGLHSTSVVIALGVTVIYWLFVYDPEIHQLDFVNFSVHACNSAIMILDLILVSHPVKLKNIYLPPLFTFVYTIFNVIYYLSGGTDRKGNHYVYKVINWNTPINAALFILGGMFLLAAIFIIIWILTVLRRQAAIRLKTKSQDIPHGPTLELPLA